MKVTFHMNSGFVGTDRHETVDIEDTSTEEDIEGYWRDWAWEHIDGYWEIKES